MNSKATVFLILQWIIGLICYVILYLVVLSLFFEEFKGRGAVLALVSDLGYFALLSLMILALGKLFVKGYLGDIVFGGSVWLLLFILTQNMLRPDPDYLDPWIFVFSNGLLSMIVSKLFFRGASD